VLLVSLACLVALGLTLVAVYRDEQGTGSEVAASSAPLPDADDARVEFPVRPFGYAPAAVDTAYEALRLNYADLLAEAPPDVVERARRRAALRAGVEQPPEEQPAPKQRAQEQPPREQPAQEQPAPKQPRTVTPAQWAGDEAPAGVEKPVGRGRAPSKRVG